MKRSQKRNRKRKNKSNTYHPNFQILPPPLRYPDIDIKQLIVRIIYE